MLDRRKVLILIKCGNRGGYLSAITAVTVILHAVSFLWMLPGIFLKDISFCWLIGGGHRGRFNAVSYVE